MTAPAPLVVPIAEAAAILRVSVDQARKLADQSRIKSVYQGSRRYIVMQSLHEYVDGLPTERVQADDA